MQGVNDVETEALENLPILVAFRIFTAKSVSDLAWTNYISVKSFTSLRAKASGVTSSYSLAHINVTRSRPAIAVGHDGQEFAKIESLCEAISKNEVNEAPIRVSLARVKIRSEILAGTLGMQVVLRFYWVRH